MRGADAFAPRTLRYRGTSLKRPTPPVRPTMALCLGTSGDPRGGGGSYERGTPVGINRYVEPYRRVQGREVSF